MLVTLGGQRELKVLTTNARENVGDQVVIGLSFTSEWLREWWKFFFDQSQSKEDQNHCNPG